MLHRMTLTERFVSWLDGKDPNETYYWPDRRECACAQFMRENGIEDQAERDKVWDKFNHVARGGLTTEEFQQEAWTFGALRDRVLATVAAE